MPRPAPRRRLVIDLVVGAQPVEGWVTGPDGEAVAFQGWIELAAQLDQWVDHEADPPIPQV